MTPSPNFAALLFVTAIAGAFLVLATVVVASVLVASRGRSIHWGKIVLAGLSLILLVPVVAIIASIGYGVLGRAHSTIYVPQPVSASVKIVTSGDPRSAEVRAGKRIVVVPPQTPAVSPPAVALQPEAPIEQSVPPVTPAASTASPAIPDWVNEKAIVADDKRLIVLSSQQYATVEEADAEIRNQARNTIQHDMRQFYQYDGSPPVPPSEIEKCFGRRHVEAIARQTGTTNFVVYRVHRQLELSGSLRRTLEPLWRNQDGQQRLWGLATLAGFITLVVATFAGYFRLDTRTGSAYRGRLRLAAVCVIMAGGVVAFGGLKAGLNRNVHPTEISAVPR